jgi:4-hydroxybenzoate polyprenyltransferase
MNLDPTWLFLSLIPSAIGFVLIVYGKKQGSWPHLVAGLALTVYPYFATTLLTLVAIGLLIGAGLWSAIRLGW